MQVVLEYRHFLLELNGGRVEPVFAAGFIKRLVHIGYSPRELGLCVNVVVVLGAVDLLDEVVHVVLPYIVLLQYNVSF